MFDLTPQEIAEYKRDNPGCVFCASREHDGSDCPTLRTALRRGRWATKKDQCQTKKQTIQEEE